MISHELVGGLRVVDDDCHEGNPVACDQDEFAA